MLGRRRRASRPAGPAVPEGVVLGRRLGGDQVLPVDSDGYLVWSFEQMRRHAVILGASGTGKTETSMRIVHQVAEKTDAPVFYLDAKGDRSSAERFTALMHAAGRNVCVFPNQRFDAWRGDWRAIVNRLLQVVPFAVEGPAAFYRDIAKTVLQLACNHPDGPPQSSAELLHRLDYELLLEAHGPTTAVLSVPRDKVSQTRLRYEAFFGQLGSLLDGDWSWEDVDAAYFLLDAVALGEDTASVASLLFADFAHYFTLRKPRDQFCVFFADEFGAISSSSDVAMKVEQARGFNTSLVLVPQTVSGMGDLVQRDRIFGSVETVISHAVNEPDRIAALVGEKRVVELTHRFERGARREEGSARLEDRPRVDPDRIRDLPVGSAWLIRRGRAARVGVQRAPALKSVPLPEQQSIDAPLERLEPEPAKTTPYAVIDEPE
jgi:hypothetical protein